MAKKRANGEGSIRKRKDGRWEGRYTVGYDKNTGKQVFKNILGKSQAEVRDKLKLAIEESKKLDFNKSGKYTLCEWIRIWYEVYIKNSIRETTAEYYRNYIENHIIPHLGSTKLEKLTTVQIQKAYNEIKDHGRIQKYKGMKNLALSDRTVRGIHIILHECLEQAVKERIISYNPTNGCRVPAKEKKEMKTLAAENISAYLKAAKEWGVLPMFYLELTSGLRRGELVALLWSDVDIENRTISVTKSATRLKGEVKVTSPKTKNSIRKIILPKSTIDLLIEEHNQHPDNPYLFPSPVNGGMRGPDCTGRIHKKLLKKSGNKSSRQRECNRANH